MYQKIEGSDCIRRLSDGACIPVDEDNTDYQEFKKWVAIKGNKLKPAEKLPKEDYKVLRKAAFQNEADPLFFQEQRGEVPEGTYTEKVLEIKKRYPK